MSDVKTLTDRALDAAIAEKIAGWKCCKPHPYYGEDMWIGIPPGHDSLEGLSNGDCQFPNYSSDLNAVREAEKALSWEQKERYAYLLANNQPPGSTSMQQIFNIVHATPRQKAEALLPCLQDK